MKKTALFLLLAAGTLALAGCQKAGLLNGESAIRFAAVSSSAGTKTAYSGSETADGSKYFERIDWKAGDKIRIWSDVATHRSVSGQHWADYKIAADGTQGAGSASDPAYYSHASLVNDGANGLVWGAATDYTFRAIYPARAISSDATSVTAACSIPASQTVTIASGVGAPDMSYAFMDGTGTTTTSSAGQGNPVTLLFSPAFTAFEITLRSKDQTLYLGSFSIQSDGGSPVAGDFTIDFGSATDKYVPSSTAGATQSQITVPLGDVALTSTADFKFTVLALPEALGDLSITFNAKDDPTATTYTARTLKLQKSGAYIPFAACAKHRIYGLALDVETWTILTVNGDNLNWDEETVPEAIIWDN